LAFHLNFLSAFIDSISATPGDTARIAIHVLQPQGKLSGMSDADPLKGRMT
jgi:hypothetical protein